MQEAAEVALGTIILAVVGTEMQMVVALVLALV
jgi:hypothetical protein